MIGKAFIFQGKASGYEVHKKLNPLLYLDNDVRAIREVLEDDWDVGERILLNQPTDISNALIGCEEEMILLYYTGHGVVVDGVFKLVGEDNENINLLDELSNIHDKYLADKRVILVIDACYSSEFIRHLPHDYQYEVLVAVKAGKAYDDEKHQKGFFTHYFCEYLKYNRNKENFLDDIGFYIEKQENSNSLRTKEPKYHFYSSLNGKKKSHITQSKLSKQIKEQIQAKYASFEALQNEMIDYCRDNKSKLFQHTNRASSFEELLGILHHKDNHKLLSCVLNPTQECQNEKEEIAKQRLIKSVILKIKPKVSDKIDKCIISGWIEDSDERYRAIDESEAIDFSKESYKGAFPQALAKMVKNRE
ncbi:MAG: caspase family protein [Campylobacterota bacterium]|nr:caspase family protein [Campylobacterota bacterium]